MSRRLATSFASVSCCADQFEVPQYSAWPWSMSQLKPRTVSSMGVRWSGRCAEMTST